MRNLKSAVRAVILGAFAFSFSVVNAQDNWCGHTPMTELFRQQNPDLVPEILKAEQQLEQEARAYQTFRGARAVKVIPVVFHVIHLNGTENISEEQIKDQMRIFNEDFNNKNADITDVVPAFTNIIGNVGIEFRLAKKDPQGNVTNGIDRIYSTQTNNGGDAAKLNPWPRDKYFNIWVIKDWGNGIPSGVLAYAYLPGDVTSSPSIDGVIVKSRFVGSIGTSSPSYARTLTHEAGHFFNLLHTWGSTNNPGVSTNCNGDDGVSDTPNCIGTFSCNLTMVSCNTLDNVQNQMDYGSCPVMFTAGQGNRMISTLNSSVSGRNNLSTPANLLATGVGELSFADFEANRLTMCEYTKIDFTDKSEYDPTSWDWTFPSSPTTSSTDENPQVHYQHHGLYDVNLSASNGTKTVTTAKVGYIMVNPLFGKFAPFSESFSGVTQLNHENWYAINDKNDAYGFVADANNGVSGSRCLRIENFGNESASKDELISTTYDLRLFSEVDVTFKIAYAQRSTQDFSKVTLYVSSNCGETWAPRWSSTGSVLANGKVSATTYTPNQSSDWKQFSVAITGSVLGQTSQFKLVFENRTGNNLYLDDFNVGGVYTDVAQLKYPFNGDNAIPNNQIIYWKASSGVEAYEYQLDSDPGFATANLQTGINNYTGIQDGPETEYTPSTLNNGETYYWRVRLIKAGVAQSWSQSWAFTVAANGLSTQDILKSKYEFNVFPNPMRDVGYVSFNLSKGEHVSLTVTDVVGKTSIQIADKYYGEGKHVFNLSELRLQTGVYVVVLKAGESLIHEKIVVQ